MSASSSSSYSSREVEGGDGGGGGVEGPSSSRSRIRWANEVWPAPFLEALAVRITVDASATVGRIAAAQALLNVFQVCSTWRAVSRSELLWQNLTRRIWNVRHLTRNTWQQEYIYRQRTACNFQFRRCVYTTLHFIPTVNNNNNNDGLSCRRLALSDHHLAAGFSDGAVHLFHLPGGFHASTFYPQHRDRLGRFSSAVSGIILSDVRIVFATLDGDIHTTDIEDEDIAPLRRAHLGDVVNHGALVDFTGCDRWWVGLYAGNNIAVACTRLRVIVFDLQNQGIILREEEPRRRIMVGLFDATNESALITDDRGVASMRLVANLDERYERYVAACSSDGTIHLWNFGAE
ncbi:UNVERIFIED_CONTAM: Transcriptional regulator STERILE APETALA [Sesamum angustifolium]|uniref:Transcriptional regulator STERILE APETALA n=1 Tax=Sesamum angustifolium TaxID=2727405 RepID=A0AAW2MU48_9LAMI